MATNSKPEKEEQKLPTYQLPFVEKPATHDELFDVHGDDPLFLRPADMDRLYGMPAATIYELIADQPVTHFPAIKMHLREDSKRAVILIPKRLFDEWLVEHSNLIKNIAT